MKPVYPQPAVSAGRQQHLQSLISAAAERCADRINGDRGLQEFVLSQPVPQGLNAQQQANWLWSIHRYWAPIWEGK